MYNRVNGFYTRGLSILTPHGNRRPLQLIWFSIGRVTERPLAQTSAFLPSNPIPRLRPINRCRLYQWLPI